MNRRGLRKLDCALFAVALLALAPCASPDNAASGLCQSDAECPVGLVCRAGRCSPPGAVEDAGAADAGAPQDGGSLEDGGAEDGGLPDGGEDAGPPLAGFGEQCNAHADCQSQICLPSARGSLCSRLCADDCPAEYICKGFLLDRNRLVNLCVPFVDLYCVACAQSSECPAAGDKCTDVGGASYCTRDCSATDACPPGYRCADVPMRLTAEGRAWSDGGDPDAGPEPVFRQCLPMAGKCPGCIDRDSDGYGAGTDCLGPDCDDTNPGVHPGAVEICNGRDDNCDGAIDEPFDLASDDRNCGACGISCDVGRGIRCCNGACADTGSSTSHCGGCGHACTGAGAACCDGACRDTLSDPAHCGACGAPCTNDHGEVGCADGRCTPVCASGFSDCDGNARNGCETAVTTLDNCGTCGATCRNAHGPTSCVGGACAPVCETGWGNCDRDNGNGCETDLLRTGAHCGRCDEVCRNDHGTTACDQGVCKPVCELSWGDCDGDPRSGCETDLASSVLHCGACRAACTNDHGTTQCRAGRCVPTCDEGFLDCDRNPGNGCETDLRTSLLHCGGCDRPCTNQNGGTTCAGGVCAPTCAAGFGDCDGLPQNGCETNLNFATPHCGGCNQPCVNARGSTQCLGGACLPTCDAGWGDCNGNPRDGCETNVLGSREHCGACNDPCVNPNGTTSCVGGACRPVCSPGFFDCNGNPRDGCESRLSEVSTCNACASDADCPGGFYCADSVCTKKKPLGDPCTVGAPPQAPGRECQSGFCVDSVCCENDCTGACRSCRLTGSRGLCTFIPSGQDPDGECDRDDPATCARDGTCDGAGSCRVWAAGTPCVTQSCAAGAQTNPRYCDGFQNCAPAIPATTLCTPYVCEGTSGCYRGCTTSAECAAGYTCVAGICKVSGGQPCGGPADCATTYCVNGVCCNEPCNGLCERCDLGGSVGMCAPVPAGQDPDDECPKEPVSSCGLTGACSGTRGVCQKYDAGTVCQTQMCAAGVQVNTRHCDGNGACLAPVPDSVACFPYLCSAATRSCFGSCASDEECVSGYGCAGGACKKVNGQACADSAECKSGFCADGVCCESRCDGTCEKCDFAGRLGTCDAVPAGQDPDEECLGEDPSTCGRTGACSGARSCALHPLGTVCAGAFCAGNTSHRADLCDGTGACVDQGTQECAPFTCNPGTGLCRAVCAAAGDCIAGYECTSGVCKKSRGVACTGDTECASGFCQDDVCCDARCSGTCEKCNLPGRLGHCDPVPAGLDPDEECAPEPVATCGRTGSCSGSRSCQLHPTGAVCAAATCATAASSNRADTCDGQGGCADNGVQSCTPYVCTAPTGECKTSCSTDGDCVVGYRCQVASGRCLKDDGQLCASDAECLNGSCCSGACRNLQTDVGHCGSCTTACTNDHGTTACVGGACQPACASGFGNCDANAANGCETDILTTTLHCGACGQPCTNAHGGTSCQGGTCAPTCDPGWGDCNGNARDGCETSTTSSVDHCAACGQACTNEHGTTQCQGSACVPSCAPGFSDCDGNARNGCETSTAQSLTHCGGCNQPCTNAHGSTVCQVGACIPTCDPGYLDCNANPRDGCETDVLGSTQHCGGCNNPCVNQNGTTSCSGGECRPVCAAGFFDCNGNPRDGCEANLSQVTTCNACTADAGCPAGFYCAAGLCTKKKPLGDGCTAANECQSGFCADGVCCENDCTGLCRSCRLTATRGFCTFIAAGQDPDTECPQDDASTCGRDGTCDGAGACRLWAAGTHCLEQSCASGVQTNLRTCDGLGNCQAAVPPTTLCAPYVCQGSVACYTFCTSDAHCAAGYTCAGGVCKVSGGQPCTTGAQCSSGFCRDGVCCNEACTGLCERCDPAGAVGTCNAVAAGTDPDNECAAEDPSTCGRTGLCSGVRGSCQLFAPGTVCQTQSCTSGVQSNTRTCNGSGTCVTPTPATVACAPYVCNAATQACFTSCASDAECTSGYGCAGSACRKLNGQPCGGDGECKSGFCQDGVCCESRCSGTCEKCNFAGREGFCDAVTAGQDPDDECAPESAASCGRTGACSGNRACALHPAGTVCVAAACAGNTSHPADSCNGLGQCVDSGTVACAPYVCDGATGRCRGTCATAADCIAGYECASGACKKSRGQSCSADGECASGFCQDGVCCASRCNGTCEKCNFASREGFCDPVPAAEDPDSECPVDPVTGCGRNGACSGARSCQLYAGGTVCNAAACVGDVSHLADTCNGLGQCVENGTQNCFPYVCDGATGLCKAVCASNADCQVGYECNAGACKKKRGVTCAADSECSSGFCQDGVCCDARCAGTCEKCNQPGREGYCDPVPAGTDPDEECPQDPVAGCQRSGACSGSRTCALYTAGTVCTAASCAGNVSSLADTCNGAGTCVEGGTQNCFPYVCNGATGLCKTVCASGADCQSGYECAAGACKKSRGVTCTADAECASGYCTDGVCCEARCFGVCEKCNQGSRLGFCDAVPQGSDPDNECAQDLVSTCGKTGVCSGTRTCQLYGAGTVCQAASCASTTSSNRADTCNGAGACVDNGVQSCHPLVCSAATGTCKASCASDGDCASGYRCKVSTGQCLKDDGQTCATNGECLNNACCSGVCRNLLTDNANCGVCGRTCVALNGSNTCQSGACVPSCNTGFGDCDGNPAGGCETSLRTNSNCNACGVICDLANASESCSTGVCRISACNAGYSSCDGLDSTGCEVSHGSYSNTCGAAEYVGSKCGDSACGFFCPGSSWSTLTTRSGRSSRWFRARANECSDCCADVYARITLSVPAGTDYDLYVYSGCGTLIASSTAGTGVTDQVTIFLEDDCFGADSGFDYWVEVRYFSGASCSNWTLTFEGTSC